MMPKTRGECLNGPRPCPHLACKYNLSLDLVKNPANVDSDYVRIVINKVSWDTGLNCVLDIADGGRMSLEDIGFLWGITRERVRQIEDRAIRKITNLKTPVAKKLADALDDWRNRDETASECRYLGHKYSMAK